MDFLNMNMQEEYAIVWETSEKLTTCIGNVDQGLLKRAVANLIQNSMSHNEDGCTIYVSVSLGAGASNGTVKIGTSAHGGFMVKLYIPVSQAKRTSFAPENALVAYSFHCVCFGEQTVAITVKKFPTLFAFLCCYSW